MAAGSPSSSGAVEFEVAGVFNGDLAHLGELRAATSDSELTDLWTAIGLRGDTVTVDFETDVMVSITIPDDSCPPELVEFVRDGEQITPTFQEPDVDCFAPLIERTYVVTIRRDSVRPAFVLRLSAQPDHGFDEARLRVEV